ncbi:MAG: hypothetical protein J6V14_07420, partial [Clostridia bacterium]|nr:hypothetical protein [Clostridia bacterium]
ALFINRQTPESRSASSARTSQAASLFSNPDAGSVNALLNELATEAPTEEPTLPPYDEEHTNVKFSDMQYRRPDMEAIAAKLAKLVETVRSGSKSVNGQLTDIMDFYMNEIYDWNSMYALVTINFSINTADPKWNEEMEFFDLNNPLLEQKAEELYVACAQSKHKARFESDIFGEGELGAYVNGPIITSKMATLMQEEAELVRQYESFDYSQLTFTIDGRTGAFDELAEWLASNGNEDGLDRLYSQLYEKLNGKLAPIYVKLIKIRKQIAAEAGYDDYEKYVFEHVLRRDYTPDDAHKFTVAVRNRLLPELLKLYSTPYIQQYVDLYYDVGEMSYGEIMDAAEACIADLGADFSEVFSYMQNNELMYLGYGSDQAGMSFTTYIFNYEAPFIVIQGSGDLTDLVTLIHEFGHFYDNYKNFGSDASLDTSEIASTALVFLLGNRIGNIKKLPESLRKAYVYQMKLDTVDLIVSQSMYHTFEHEAYALPDSELTVERLNQLAAFTADSFHMDGSLEYAWPTISHFYVQPFYVISYVMSSSVSLMFYDAELDSPGKGLDMYLDFINSFDPNQSFLEAVERAGLKSPFTKDGFADLLTVVKRFIK